MGCQMNEYDADYLSQLLVEEDFLPTSDPKTADMIVINTCSVREKAEQKAFSLLGRMIALKKRKSGLIVGMMGCIAQQEGGRLMERFPDLDFVMGTRELYRFPEIFHHIYFQRERIVATDLSIEPVSPRPNAAGFFEGRVKSYISIMQGCNNFCSYCIVPYVRGREVSRPPEDIIREAKELIARGIKEITLLGQNVNSYAWKGKERFSFPDLLRQLSLIDGLIRLRFTTSHPKDISPELIGCYAELENLCSHIHLPFQAGSNRVLKRMNRGYTREKYMELIEILRYTREDMAITSDVMVGFPGETEADFELTLDLIQKIEFDGLFSFKYSDRKGTKAENLKKKVPEEEKSRRLTLLQALQKGITINNNRLMKGKVLDVLVEGQSKRGEQLSGRTDTNIIVNFNGDNRYVGKLVKVLIEDFYAYSLQGKLI
jgi:tRNA-2-methylthio-N6-dimethylallyladenosine synthase